MLRPQHPWRVSLVLTGLFYILAGPLWSQSHKPVDIGTQVNGYQDDFNGTTLNAGWQVQGASVYFASNGVLRVYSGSGDPNHLYYAVGGASGTTQEILARVRLLSLGTGDAVRCGVAVGIEPSAPSQAGGINFLFRDHNGEGQTGRHVSLLDDLRAWGPGYTGAFNLNTWYWMRLRQEPNAQGGTTDVFARFWRADGSEAEPANWQLTWDYVPTRAARNGYAGITASSSGGLAEFEVDYVLIKAAGLPAILVNPEAFPAIQQPVAITNEPQDAVVNELGSVTLQVQASGYPPLTYQWYKNGQLLTGATSPRLALSNVPISDDGAQFYVVVGNVASNVSYSVTSRVVTLQVIPDFAPPELLRLHPQGLTGVKLYFSEPLSEASATSVLNYYLLSTQAEAVAINAAVLSENGREVTLETAPMVEGMGYVLNVYNLRDRAAAGNVMPQPVETNFVAVGLTPMDIEGSQPAGWVEWLPGGYRVTGGYAGTQISQEGGTFAGNQITGDFDVRVKVSRLEAGNLWARAGLTARVSEETSQNYSAVYATPSIAGCYFLSQSDGTPQIQGRYPVNYPATWLRLQREEDNFYGYASTDGIRWVLLGQAVLEVPETLWVGLTVASHEPEQMASADFLDFSETPSPVTVPLTLEREGMGPSSRRTGLVISEIMYRPAPHPTITNSMEFIEIANTRGEPEDLSGWRISGDISYTFPEGTILPGGGFLVVARSPQDIQSLYQLPQVWGPFTNNLPNNKGTIRLRHRTGAVMLEVTYRDEPPWPVAADGSGHSLVLVRPSYGESSPLAWGVSDQLGGSPGRWDGVTAEPLKAVVINELMAHSAGIIGHDYLELFNKSNTPLDISGCTLSDDTGTNRFTVPAGTVIAGRGWISFSQFQMGFPLNGGGGRLFLRHPDGRVLDAVRYPPQATEAAYGRYPDGSPSWQELVAQTPGASNAPILIRDVVINEIMYAPISGLEDDQYIELFNKGTNTLNIGGWAFVDGIDFQFPPETVLPPQSYVVVAKNVTNLLAKYPQLNSSNTYGNFRGSLSGRGERVALAMFEASLVTNQVIGLGLVAPPPSSQIITDPASTPQAYVVVDEVTYHNGGRWGKWSHRGGSSLELVDPRSDNRLAANWADSDESQKAPWTTIARTGLLDLGNVTADSLQVLPLGAGEYVLDDVVVLNASGQNVMPNGQFTSGSSGWVAEGALSLSRWTASEGVNNTGAFWIKALDRGDNQINRVRASLSAALGAGTSATLQAKVRWLRGHPEMLMRLRGNWLEVAARLELPPYLGTPGLPNSRLVLNAPPAIYEITHNPVVPAAQQPVRVTARIHDPDGVAAFQLHYRVDPMTNYTVVAMRDDGSAGDEQAGDGIYSAVIGGQPSGTVVAFFLSATDGHANPATSRYPADAPARECVVRFGEATPQGTFPIYRLWMTQNTFTNWSARHKLDNSPNPITFVLNNERVIYEAEAQFAGSPYIAPGFNTPAGNRCGYSISFPADDRLFGARDLVLDWPGGHGGETTAIQEQMAYALAEGMGLPFSHRHFIRLFVHGVPDMQRGGVFEAVLQPAGEYLEQWSPDQPEGDFYKIDRAFEFDNNGNRVADPMPRLEVYQSGGQKKIERYRWTWLKRSYDSALDYSQLMNLVDALNATSPEPYTTLTESLADVEQWMGVFAFEHIINNFDSWGHNIGKNMYMFRPRNGRWVIYPFDLDWLMLVSPRGPGGFTALSGPLFASEDPTVTRMYNHPPFRRAYFRAVQRAIEGPMRPEIAEPLMDVKYRTLVANGITLCDGQSLTDPRTLKEWYAQRRGFLQSQLASVQAEFSVATNYLTSASNYFAITGTAPVEVTTITVNGVPWKPVWTSVTNWTLLVPGTQTTNLWTVNALDSDGQAVGSPQEVTAVFTNVVPPAKGSIVFSEIMYHPTDPEAQYLELLNVSSNYTFDISGWRINGLGFTFPPGSALLPGQYLLLAKNREAFARAYGSGALVSHEYSGNLQQNGETLTLLRPLPGTAEEIVAQVRYEPSAPWAMDTPDTALQLRDGRRDIRRVMNWGNGNSWQFKSFTMSNTLTLNFTNLYFRFSNAGEVWLDDLRIVETNPLEGEATNYVVNGDFEGPLEGTWVKGTLVGPTERDGTVSRSGQYSLRLVATGRAQSVAQSLSQPLTLKTGTVYTVSFWYLPSQTLTGLHVYLTAFVNSNVVVHAPVYARSPGAAAQGERGLPELPLVWLNEVQAENVEGVADNYGEREPWVELYNGGSTAVDLTGWYLANQYTNLGQWAFPAGTVLGPGEYRVVWCDGQVGQTVGTNLHTNFRLSGGAGSVALVMPVGAGLEVLDYLYYRGLLAGRSYGNYPDGQPVYRRVFHYATAGTTNNPALAPVPVFINEWMADNRSSLADPEDGNFEDWFELYNAGDTEVDLGGYYLTDNPANPFQFRIPNGWVIPAQGFLVVWADNEAGQNVAGGTNLHVNFALNRSGEYIGLFAPDGTRVDSVEFGPQAANLTFGRYPDGESGIYGLAEPTPGAPNATLPSGNQRPIIEDIPPQTMIAGQRLELDLSAFDLDWPPQTLTFLQPVNAPAGMNVSAQGHLVWAPTPTQAGVHDICVRVRDDGIPNLTATNCFTVVVHPPPQFHAPRLDAQSGNLTLRWSAIPNKWYQLETSQSLTAPVWEPVGGPISAGENVLEIQVPPPSSGQRYYRVKVY